MTRTLALLLYLVSVYVVGVVITYDFNLLNWTIFEVDNYGIRGFLFLIFVIILVNILYVAEYE